MVSATRYSLTSCRSVWLALSSMSLLTSRRCLASILCLSPTSAASSSLAVLTSPDSPGSSDGAPDSGLKSCLLVMWLSCDPPAVVM